MKNRRHPILFVLSVLTFLLSSQLVAKEWTSKATKTNLIELYTSEGCSSCPPADRWLSDLQQDPGLFKTFIPLAFHVDYWDYLGWKDNYGDPAHSDRQRRYVREGFVSQVYTPGFVVNSREWRGWFKGKKRWPSATDASGVLSAKLENDRLVAEFSDLDRQYVINVAFLGLGLSSSITSGENHGKRLEHDFVVLDLIKKQGKGRWEIILPEVPNAGQRQTAIAIWLTDQNSPQVVQAVGGFL